MTFTILLEAALFEPRLCQVKSSQHLSMAGKKAKPEMPSNIPSLLLISGDIINPVKLLMDTAGQVVGKRSQDGSGNTKTEIKNEAKSISSKHKIRTTKGAKEKENRDQGSKAKGNTNKHNKEI